MPVILKIYLIWPLFVYLYKNMSKKSFVCCLIIIAVFLLIAFPYNTYIENSINLYWCIPIFIFGMLLAFIYNYYKQQEKIIWDYLCIMGIIGIIIFTPLMRKLLWDIEPSAYLQNKYLLISSFWIIIILSCLFGKYFKKILEKCYFLQWIGKLSYSIYLFHYVILWKLNSISIYTRGLIVILVSLLAATFINKIIDETYQKNRHKFIIF